MNMTKIVVSVFSLKVMNVFAEEGALNNENSEEEEQPEGPLDYQDLGPEEDWDHQGDTQGFENEGALIRVVERGVWGCK